MARKKKKQDLKAVRAAKARRRIRIQKVIRAFIIALELMILAVLGVVAFVVAKYNKVDKVDIKESDVSINEEVGLQLSGYTTIALFGGDSREGELEEGTRTDTIMIAAIDNDTKVIRIASIYRDTLLEMKDGSYMKANAAYSLGGPSDAIAMLNKNLDLNITDYVTVDFGAMSDAIDLMGGLEIKVTDAEAEMMNKYIKETAKAAHKKKEAKKLKKGGTYTLNGPQAVTYARLRKLEGGDYKRTERQRIVIQKMYEKAKTMSITDINKIIDTVFPQISTSIDLSYALQLAACYKDYTLGDQTGFPFEKTDGIIIPNVGDSVVAYGLADNVMELHEFLYPGSVPELREGITTDKVADIVAKREAAAEEAANNSDDESTESSVAEEEEENTQERYEVSSTVSGISSTIQSKTNVMRPYGTHWTWYDEKIEPELKKAEEKEKDSSTGSSSDSKSDSKSE